MLNELAWKNIDKTNICSGCATRNKEKKEREEKETMVETRKFQDYNNP